MKESEKEKKKRIPSYPIRDVKCIIFPVSHENGFLFFSSPSHFRVVHGDVFSGDLQSSVI